MKQFVKEVSSVEVLHSLLINLNADLSTDCLQRSDWIAENIQLFILWLEHSLLNGDSLTEEGAVTVEVSMMMAGTVGDVL